MVVKIFFGIVFTILAAAAVSVALWYGQQAHASEGYSLVNTVGGQEVTTTNVPEAGSCVIIVQWHGHPPTIYNVSHRTLGFAFPNRETFLVECFEGVLFSYVWYFQVLEELHSDD